MSIKRILLEHRNAFQWAFTVYEGIKEYFLKKKTCKRIRDGVKSGKPIVYYCGVPAHDNLGDLAQGICIKRWLKKHYAEYYVLEIETNALVNTRYSCLQEVKKAFSAERDFVVFQSGYTTTDLGGHADMMHQAVMNALPAARILMMPQTIFFKSEARKILCSEVYDSHKRMLFLSRDTVSFEMAQEMFPNVPQKCYPDIVTTLIGRLQSNQDREGIIFCLRDDAEKYYSDNDLSALMEKCKSIGPVTRTDTTKGKHVAEHAEEYIRSEIEEYSKYKVMITDRYHGTILSLVAATPVIIIKTVDHKVTTGADWFRGVYDDCVYLADDLDAAYDLAEKLYERTHFRSLEPYFEEKYYDKLPAVFAELVK